jgi:NAD(P)-dependent dehydrogenase (short-subunit alcohol dehydrogenase family)
MSMGVHSGTTALVIGGTQGLGFAIASRLVAEGCRQIVIAGRDTARGAAAADQISGDFIAADLEDTNSILALVDQAAARMGGVTALVNAGAMTTRGSVLDTTPAAFDRMMTANLRSPFFAIQRVSQLAISAGKPAAIVNILSMVTHCGQSFLAPYSASKAGLANVTKNAANALRHHRIRVNGINCGWMDTPGEDAVQKQFHNADDDWLEKAEGQQPFKMLVKPDHVAVLASYMLSDGSGVMTGSLVDFDQNVAGAYPEH